MQSYLVTHFFWNWLHFTR